MSERRFDLSSGKGYDKGRPLLMQAQWFVVSLLIFQAWWCSARFRPAILRAFGASVGRGVHIRDSVRVHSPWKLTVGEHVWIGKGAALLNLEPISVGDHVCTSPDAVLCFGSHCVGSHLRRSASFEHDNASIGVGRGAWIALRAVVLRGVQVSVGATAPAGAVIMEGTDCMDAAWPHQADEVNVNRDDAAIEFRVGGRSR